MIIEYLEIHPNSAKKKTLFAVLSYILVKHIWAYAIDQGGLHENDNDIISTSIAAECLTCFEYENHFVYKNFSRNKERTVSNFLLVGAEHLYSSQSCAKGLEPKLIVGVGWVG